MDGNTGKCPRHRVGDFKANENPTEFLLLMAYNASAFNRNNLPLSHALGRARAQAPSLASEILGIVANFSRLTAIRKPELTTPATFSTLNYRQADTYNAQWQALAASTEAVARKIPRAAQSAFFETVGHPVTATANLHALYVAEKKIEDLASQASGSANTDAKMVQDMFETDWELREKFHTLEGGKWDHMMDQTHLGYYYWQQPMQDTLPPLRFVRTRAPALAGTMRITVEGSLGGWPGDNRNNCKDGYNCGQPVLATLSPRSRYVDVSPSGSRLSPSPPRVLRRGRPSPSGGSQPAAAHSSGAEGTLSTSRTAEILSLKRKLDGGEELTPDLTLDDKAQDHTERVSLPDMNKINAQGEIV
ncbi:hypothetical protein EXIGLDRAFT_693880 [Exidia glandulosa HHB12029]|uniref:Uncharacterized protein n=1 Tax=Exidia glandulosa HHB12029 TaxID=1314781 RepID=A0A165NS80_EXIGL|nr:hypothetical protein EXIGLDRAFT_693880 [Exidia glandulosa HHB12029]